MMAAIWNLVVDFERGAEQKYCGSVAHHVPLLARKYKSSICFLFTVKR